MPKSDTIPIIVSKLTKTYSPNTGIKDLSFQVRTSEIFGIVGPNGAGKTTTLECIEGLREPTSGTVNIFGVNSWSQAVQLRDMIGIQLQSAELPGRLKVWEAMDLFSSFYSHVLSYNDLLEKLVLQDKRNSYISKLSGGQKQRLFIALALLNDPEVLFFDELTTGLDPHARRSIWELLLDIKKAGKTIVLTTHSMEEVERLCDRVAILDHAQLIALDTPTALISKHKAKNFEDVYLELTGAEVRD